MVKLLVDVSEIYHKLYRRFNHKLDYEKYLSAVEARFGVVEAVAYGSQTKGEAKNFIACLKNIGFEAKYKRPRVFTVSDREIKQCHHGIEITVEAMNSVNDTVFVLGISNTDYIPLIQELQAWGCKVVIFASGVPHIMHKVADEVIEITPDLFEDENDD